jgi:uncharacterized protein YycO
LRHERPVIGAGLTRAGFLTLACAALAASSAQGAPGSDIEARGKPRASLHVRLPVLEAGDVVFIGVDGAFWARTASEWSTPAHRFGHVGIAAGADAIVHATGSPTANDARVTIASLADFTVEADRIGVYRPHDSALAQAAAAEARRFAALGLSFDKGFRLESRDSLYCSELIWRALSAGAGRDVTPAKQRFMGRDIITLADLETSALLSEIAFVERDV